MSSGNKKKLKEALYSALSPQLQKTGFSQTKGSDRYVREHDDSIDTLQLVWLDHGDGWRIQPNAGIRYERVENIFHGTSGFEEQYKKGTSTVGAAIGVIAGGTAGTCEFLLESLSQVEPVATGIVSAYEEFGAPYFDHWSTLESIDAELNEKPSEKAPHLRGGPTWFRCSTGVIVAKLVGRPNYDDLVSFYTGVMAKDNKGFYLKRFEALVDLLKTLPVT